MSVMPNPHTFGRAINRKQSDDFALLRSHYVDNFSKAELRLSQLCVKLGLNKVENASTGQKLKCLQNLKPNPQLSRVLATRIAQLCASWGKQVEIRNGVVHATMTIGTKASVDVAFFQKTSDAVIEHPAYFVLSADDFKSAIATVLDLNSSLGEMLNPPLPQPSPSAKAAL
jgi:hypothetical protein